MKYYSGKRCRRGHLGKRYSSSKQCVECVKIYKSNTVKVNLQLHPTDADLIKSLAKALTKARKLTLDM